MRNEIELVANFEPYIGTRSNRAQQFLTKQIKNSKKYEPMK